MIVKIYYCDICKKRIEENQRIYFEKKLHYHSDCKFKEMGIIIPEKYRVFSKKTNKILKELLTN